MPAAAARALTSSCRAQGPDSVPSRDFSRGLYLLALLGHEVDEESNVAMPPEFLMEQMEWREAVAEGRQAHDLEGLEQLRKRVKARTKKRYDQLAEALDDQRDYALAADRARRLMFLEKLLSEIDDAMADLEE